MLTFLSGFGFLVRMKGASLPVQASDDGEKLYAEFLHCYEGNKTAPVSVRAGDVEISYHFEDETSDESSPAAYDITRIEPTTSSSSPLLVKELERSHRRAAERTYPKHGVVAMGFEMCGTIVGFAAVLGLVGLIAGTCAVVFGVLMPFQLI